MCSLLRIKLEISVCCTCLLHSIIWSPEWNSKQKLVLFLLWIVTMKDFRNAMSYDCCFFLSFLFFFSKLFLGNMNFWKIIFYFCGFNSSLLHFRNSITDEFFVEVFKLWNTIKFEITIENVFYDNTYSTNPFFFLHKE